MDERAPLSLLPYEDEGLRCPSQDVSFPLSPSDAKLVDDMLYSVQDEQLNRAGAPWASAAGMAAPQWGKQRRIFVWRRHLLEGGKPGPEFAVVVNPEYEGIAEEEEAGAEDPAAPKQVEAWEGCFSVPGMRGKVRRFRRVRATFNEVPSGERRTVLLEDWPARVFQHECDHLNGQLYDDVGAGRCSCKVQVTL